MDRIQISLNSKDNILKVLYMKKIGSLSTWTQFQAPIISYIVHMGKKMHQRRSSQHALDLMTMNLCTS